MNFNNLIYGRIFCILMMKLIISESIKEIQSESVNISNNKAILNSMNRNCYQYFKTLYGIISKKKFDWKRLSKMKEWNFFVENITKVFNVCNRNDYHFRRWLLRGG